MKVLRKVQETAIAMIRQSLGRGNTRIMVQAPTGMGKTVLASHMVQGALRKGKRVMFVVPAISLIEQSVASFEADGVHAIGVVQAQHYRTDAAQPVQVCSIQTLMRRDTLPEADLVIIDEAHKWFRFYEGWFQELQDTPVNGLSATPWTKGLGHHYDDLIIAATTQELIDAGLLSPFKVFAPSSPDMKGVRTTAGDYNEGDLSGLMNDKSLTADVVSTWLARGEDRQTLVFGVDRLHAKSLQEAFIAAGVVAEYMDANTQLEEREAIAKKFHEGFVRVVCNVGVLTTGIDWDVRCVVLCRPTKSEILFTQIIGRGLRTADAKEFCLILDHSNSHNTLGLVTEIHHEHLCKAKKGQQTELKPKEKKENLCSACKFVKMPGVEKCSECGQVDELKKSNVVTIDGELIELSAGQKRNNKNSTPVDKRQFYGELLGYCKLHGKTPGYASHIYKAKMGVWPNAYKDAEIVAPGAITLSYIKSRQIAYARSSRRG